MKKSILITVCALIAALCCFSFAACDLLAGEKDVSGNYKLESFTTKDGSTYNAFLPNLSITIAPAIFTIKAITATTITITPPPPINAVRN